MGLKTAHRLLKQCGSVGRALAAARMEGMKVPATYQRDFEKAEKTFVFQRVFHRSSTTGQTRMVTLTPCTGQTGIEDEDCIGPMLPEELIDGISRGEVDPITKEPIVDLVPMSPPRHGRARSMAATSSAPNGPNGKPKWIVGAQSTGQKTLDTFFSKSRPVVQKQVIDAPTRQPLAPMTNTVSNPAMLRRDVVENTPVEKSKYFADSTLVQSSPDLVQAGFEHHLATFTPTHSRKALARCLSTDSGEISSPASSSIKRAKERLHSSPLIEDDGASSPNTSPTITRPRFSTSRSPSKEVQCSDIEEDEEVLGLGSLQGSLFEKFAFRQPQQTTPMISSRSGTTALLKRSTDTAPRGSASSGKRRLTALLHFHNDENDDDDVFCGTNEQTPTIRRSHSDSTFNNELDRPLGIKRINTTYK